MSRTKRNYQHKRLVNILSPAWERQWENIYPDYYPDRDPRDAYKFGFDGESPAYYCLCKRFPSSGWEENIVGLTRFRIKKATKRARRQYHKRVDNKELQEHYYSSELYVVEEPVFADTAIDY